MNYRVTCNGTAIALFVDEADAVAFKEKMEAIFKTQVIAVELILRDEEQG